MFRLLKQISYKNYQLSNIYKCSYSTNKNILWGLIADTHFKEQSLSDIILSTDWAINHFKENNVNRVFLLGDILNTRQMVHVGAQSAAMAFIGKLIDHFPVHVIVGNHDMHLKHSRSITSLDVLGLNPFSDKLSLHKQIELVYLDNIPVLMLPYHQNESELQEQIIKFQELHSNINNKIIGMAHLSVNGAISNKRAGIKFNGFLTPELFKPFLRTFSGHFHSHQTIQQTDNKGGPFTYVGSPLQFNFGDINDDKRGVILYNPQENEFKLSINPYAKRFIELNFNDISEYSKKELNNNIKDEVSNKFVLMSGVESRSISLKQLKEYNKIRKQLLDFGALNVRRSLQSLKTSKNNQNTNNNNNIKLSTHYKFKDLIHQYVTYRNIENNKFSFDISEQDICNYGSNIMDEVDLQQENDFKTIFEAEIKQLTMENFLGVKGIQILDMENLPDGIWYIQGSNGSGKSTIAEAITWCLFGQLIRSDTKADYVINDSIKKNCRIRIDYKNGKSIERFRKYSELGGSGFRIYENNVYQELLDKGNRDSSQKLLSNIIGIHFQNFTSTVALADDTARNFVSASPSKRRQIIEELLGFGKFEQYLLHARSIRRDIKNTIFSIDTTLNFINSNIETNINRIGQYKHKILQTQENISKIKNATNDNITQSNTISLEKDIEELHNTLTEAKKEAKIAQLILQYRSLLSKFNTQYNSLTSNLLQYQLSLTDLYSVQTSDKINVYIDNLQKHINNYISFINKTISNIPNNKTIKEQLIKEQQKIEETINNIKEHCDYDSLNNNDKNKLIENKNNIKKFEDLITKTSNDIEELEKHHNNELINFNKELETPEIIEDLINKWNDEYCHQIIGNVYNCELSLAENIHKLNENKNTTTIELSSLQREIELYNEMIETDEKEIYNYKEEYKKEENKLKYYQKQQELINFWENSFGRGTITSDSNILSMRDYVFQDSLKELNISLKQSLEYLCDDGINYHDLDTSLDLNFAFTGSEYGKRSSGERRRTALALFFALVELTRLRSAHQTQFVILDEIFDALDASGQDAAHKLIQRLHTGSDYNSGIKKVFVITHSPITAGLCHTLKVEKDNNGTTFIPHPIWNNDLIKE